jgi:hypothetical protein
VTASPTRSFIIAALAASSLALPAAAASSEPAPASTAPTAFAADVSSPTGAVDVPSPRARPAQLVRKRVASLQPRSHRVTPRRAAYWTFPPYERIAAHWPILFIGIGF